jgi:hypothetical protein
VRSLTNENSPNLAIDARRIINISFAVKVVPFIAVPNGLPATLSYIQMNSALVIWRNKS